MPWSRWLPFDATLVINTRAGWAIPFNSVSDFDLPACTSTRPAGSTTSCLEFVQDFGAQADGLSNIDDDLELTLSERYFLGGLGYFQLRGFKQRSVGPRRSVLVARTTGSGNPFDATTTFAPGEVAFNSFGFAGVDGDNATSATCTFGPAWCNSITDKQDDDFEDLDLADVIGGNKMFLLNLELQFPISEELGLTGIAFLDMGNAFAENDGFNPADLRFGAGLGVNWFSPFGPIMVILGIPLDKLDDEDAAVFEFSMGGSQF